MKISRFFKKKTPYLCLPLNSHKAQESAELHKESFAHSWEAQEFEAILSAVETIADGIVDDDGLLQGMAITRVVAGEGEILTIAIRKRHRSKGNGALLLEYHLNHLIALGVERIFLEVSEENLPAQNLYRKFNFKQIGRRRGYYRASEGFRTDALVMARDL